MTSRSATKAAARWWRVWCAVWRDIGSERNGHRGGGRRVNIGAVSVLATMAGIGARYR